MPKKLLLTASAVILLMGCQKNEVDLDSSNQAIGFTTYSVREVTKATSLGSDDSFNVTAYYRSDASDVAYFSNQLFAYDASSQTFVSNPTRYWPTTGVLDFYAVSPVVYEGTSTGITAGKTVDFTADGVTDFIAALLTDQSKLSVSTPTLTFSHKLTKVAVKAKGSDSNLKYVISSVTIKADNASTYSFVSGGDGTWAASTSSNTYTVTSDKTIGYDVTDATSIGDPLYLLPNQRTDASTVVLKVVYQVYQKDSGSKDCLVYSATKSVDLTSSATVGDGAWGINKFITYSLVIPASDDAGVISVTSTLNGWDDDIKAAEGGSITSLGDSEEKSW